ncbi:MAG: hypothetical protein ACRDY6_18930 [Acidimicrobiia bacterium]
MIRARLAKGRLLDDWRILRFDYTDVTRRGDYIVDTVRAALDASRALK